MDYSVEVRRRFAAALAAAPQAKAGDAPTATGQAEDRAQGVWVRARIRVGGKRIEAAQFDVWGCPHTLAAASLAAQRMRGAALEAFAGLGIRDLARELGIPVEKLGRLLCIEDAALAAVGSARVQLKKGIDNGSITD